MVGKNSWSCETNTPWSSSKRSKLSFLRKLARVWYLTCGACFNLYKALHKQQSSLRMSSNKCSSSKYIIPLRNLYRKVVTTFFCQILYLRFILTPNRHFYNRGLTKTAKILIKSINSSCLKPWATYLALYFMMWLLRFFINLKYHRPVMTCRFSGSSVSSQVSLSIKESYSACITSFHLVQ